MTIRAIEGDTTVFNTKTNEEESQKSAFNKKMWTVAGYAIATTGSLFALYSLTQAGLGALCCIDAITALSEGITQRVAFDCVYFTIDFLGNVALTSSGIFITPALARYCFRQGE